MSDFLATLAARGTGDEPGIMPRLPARFEPEADVAGRHPFTEHIVEETSSPFVSTARAEAGPVLRQGQDSGVSSDGTMIPGAAPVPGARVSSFAQEPSGHLIPDVPVTRRDRPTASQPAPSSDNAHMPPLLAARPSAQDPGPRTPQQSRQMAQDTPLPPDSVPEDRHESSRPRSPQGRPPDASGIPAEPTQPAASTLPPETTSAASSATMATEAGTPRPPRTIEVMTRRMDIRPAPAAGPREYAAPHPEPPPAIHVTIGRVDVRAPTTPPGEHHRQKAQPTILPLTEYLRQRKGGA